MRPHSSDHSNQEVLMYTSSYYCLLSPLETSPLFIYYGFKRKRCERMNGRSPFSPARGSHSAPNSNQILKPTRYQHSLSRSTQFPRLNQNTTSPYSSITRKTYPFAYPLLITDRTATLHHSLDFNPRCNHRYHLPTRLQPQRVLPSPNRSTQLLPHRPFPPPTPFDQRPPTAPTIPSEI